MTEEEVRQCVCDSVPRETARRLERYVERLTEEATRQNLISAATVDQMWQRHILDSAQLLPLGPPEGLWLDIGSGAGLPGLIVAILRPTAITLVEPRAKRAAFLTSVVQELGLSNTTICASTAASAPKMDAAVISARAVAALDTLFTMGSRFAGPSTTWVLPKGRSAAEELARAQSSWQGDFRLVPSQTDSSASIVVARGVRPR